MLLLRRTTLTLNPICHCISSSFLRLPRSFATNQKLKDTPGMHDSLFQPSPSEDTDYLKNGASLIWTDTKYGNHHAPAKDFRSLFTEVSIYGDVRYIREKLAKSFLTSLDGVETRDLRRLDGTIRNQLPVILSRPSAILVNMHKVKAVIKSDMVIFIDGVCNSETRYVH